MYKVKMKINVYRIRRKISKYIKNKEDRIWLLIKLKVNGVMKWNEYYKIGIWKRIYIVEIKLFIFFLLLFLFVIFFFVFIFNFVIIYFKNEENKN